MICCNGFLRDTSTSISDVLKGWAMTCDNDVSDTRHTYITSVSPLPGCASFVHQFLYVRKVHHYMRWQTWKEEHNFFDRNKPVVNFPIIFIHGFVNKYYSRFRNKSLKTDFNCVCEMGHVLLTCDTHAARFKCFLFFW